jgi:long-chain acyl-CoA synthetase
VSKVGARNLARLADDAFDRHGDHPSLYFEGTWYGSGELWERGARLAAGLVEQGIEPGDRVVVMMENSPDVGVLYNAIARAGAVIVPAMFLLTADEVRRIVVDSGASAVITSPSIREVVDAAVKDVLTVRLVASTGNELDALAATQSAQIVPRDDDDLAALVYTGGTTGRSKGVMLTHANLWEAGRSGHLSSYIPGVTRSLTSLPLSHSYGVLVFVSSLHATEPPEAVLMRWFEARSWLSLAQGQRVQFAAVVPSMLYRLLAEPLEDYDLSALQQVVSGAAPLSLKAIEEFTRRVPGVELREGYGLTETSALCSSNPPGANKPGTVGRPVPGTEVRLLDEAGNEVPPGDAGEIWIRSKLVMSGYWNEPQLTAEALRDGWVRTGDVGRLDEAGYLAIVDRKKDLILRGGFNVFPRDVEETLLEHPSVTAACVVGRPDSLHGEEVIAFVTLAEGCGTGPDELSAFAKERLAAYKYPREIRVLSSLPMTLVGKFDRKALRELLTKQGAKT